jgi:hypothetical protein
MLHKEAQGITDYMICDPFLFARFLPAINLDQEISAFSRSLDALE